MQKPAKKRNSGKTLSSSNKKYFRKNLKRSLRLSRFKNFIKSKRCGRPFEIYRNFLSKSYSRLSVTIKPNNIFCSLRHNIGNKTLKSISSGKYKIKTTRKRLKFNTGAVLTAFFKDLKKVKIPFSKFVVICIVAPLRQRKAVLKIISRIFIKQILRKKRYLIQTRAKKVFNGCRSIKKHRKKRKGFRLFK